MKKDKLISIIVGTIVLIAIYIGLYPTISNYYWQSKQTSTIYSYNETLKNTTKEKIQQLKDRADKYNEQLYEKFKTSIFTYQGSSATDENYESQLNMISTSMGYIEIPKINVYLPIAHGTKTEDLDSMAGHLYQSSLPVGGTNTHAIISAHTGLAQTKLFTDLDQLSIGDEFYIYTLNKKLCYKVVEINVCTPEEDYHYMQIEPGKDLVSLYTCTPYGINDHRLIIKGEHDTSKDKILEVPKDDIEVKNQNRTNVVMFYVLIGVPLLLYGTYIFIILRKGKKHEGQE